MKVRNLLLASLAVAAMTACSNENDEFVNNGNQTGEKNAIMEFGIAFPSLTRATGGCVKSKHQVFFDILYKKGNALYLFILVFLLLSFGK